VLASVPAVFSYVYVPGTLIVSGDAAATAERIRASEWLLRLGIASELISSIAFIFLVLALYRLFKGVDQERASLMVILVLVSIPVSFVNVLSELGALVVLSGADFLSVLGGAQLDALAFVLLRLHNGGLFVAQIFWGLWLFPLALLALGSGFVPRFVGVLLIVAGTAYVAESFAFLVLPAYAGVVSSVAKLAEAGEASIIVWLLITRTVAPSFARVKIAPAS